MEVLVLAGASTLSDGLVAALEGIGSARPVAKPAEAEHELASGRYEVLVFDPELASPDFLRRQRRRNAQIALVARLQRSSTAQAADLLEQGADEVVDATMGAREVRARMLLAAGRTGGARSKGVTVDDLTIDAAQAEARWRGSELPLTRRERELLEVLAAAAGRAVRREAIYREVWGYTMARGDRTVDVNVKRLREKLASATGSGVGIKTVQGIGYRLELAGTTEAVTAS